MAFSTKVGSFAANTSTGNQSVTGVGFQPKAIIFNITDLTADGSSANLRLGVGFAISSSSRATISGTSDDASAPHNANGGRHDNTKCINIINGSLSTLLTADLVTMDADGFTINITTTDASARIINYIALGGTDLTNVFIKEFTSKTSTGSQAHTGVGFQPDSLLLFNIMSSTAPASTRTNGFFQIGMAKSATKRATAFFVDNGASNSVTVQRTDKVIETSNGGSVFYSADLTSMDADGFTLNWTTANGTARYFWALCLKGGQFDIGKIDQATSTGNQAKTGVGFQPTGLLLLSANKAAGTGDSDNAKLSMGLGASSSSRVGIWGGGVDADPSDTNSNLDQTKIMKTYTAGTPTLLTSADLVSLDSDGFTINNGTVDATSREILYLAFGSTAVSTSVKDLISFGMIPFAR